VTSAIEVEGLLDVVRPEASVRSVLEMCSLTGCSNVAVGCSHALPFSKQTMIISRARAQHAEATNAEQPWRSCRGPRSATEPHFRSEERLLLSVLETLALEADPLAVLGP
jgi:hypothetical protein